MLFDKHKGIFAVEVDDIVGKFGKGLKGLRCNRMATLLRDVGYAIPATMSPVFASQHLAWMKVVRKRGMLKLQLQL